MNREFREGNLVWSVLGIITIIIGLLFSFVGPNLIHFILFTAGDLLITYTPIISNYIFAISVVCLALFFFAMYFPNKKARWVAGFSVVLSLVLAVISVTNYTVLREERILHSSYLSIVPTEYVWTDVEESVLLKRNDDIDYETLVLSMNDGEEFSFKRDPALKSRFDRVEYILQGHGISTSIQDR